MGRGTWGLFRRGSRVTFQEMKKCYRCGLVKPVTEFHKNSLRPDGVTTACKPCANVVSAQWKAANKERAKRVDIEYRRLNPEKRRAIAQYHRDTFPERTAAQAALRNAVRIGSIKPEPCFMCGEKAEAHHAAYSLPLHVTWLCRSHHRQIHVQFL